VEDKRRHKRFSVEGIQGNMLFSSEINILNISVGGAAIETPRRLNLGGEYTLKLEDKGKTFSIKGKVVWSELSQSRKTPSGDIVPIYRTGLQFVDVLTESAEALLGFLEAHKSTPDGRLGGIRFRIHAPERAVLSMPYSYKVKRLSAGGMLIESYERLSVDDRFPMEIFIPMGSAHKAVGFIGRVASCIEVEDSYPRHYDVGIEFLDMSEDSKNTLMEFIKSLEDAG